MSAESPQTDGSSRPALARYPAPTDGLLSRAMLADYGRDGVLILENFVTPGQCNQLIRQAQALAAGFDPATLSSVFSTTDQAQLDDRYFIDSGDKIRFFLEQDALDENGKLRYPQEQCLNKIGHALHDLDPVYDRFSHSDKLAGVARSLGYQDPVIIQSMHIFKSPRIGGEVVCHQDSTYIYTDPESCTGFWFALEDATIDNGCMYFIPQQHKGPLKQRNYRLNDSELVTETLDASPWPEDINAPAEARAGSLVIFDGRTPHFSGPNRSSQSRHAYTLHAIDRRAHYPADNWLQRSADLPLRGFR